MTTFLSAALFFLAACLSVPGTGKSTSVFLIFLTLFSVFLFYDRLRDRIHPPILSLGAVVLLDGLSNIYAVAGKFALQEFLKVLSAFCLAMLLLAFTNGRDPGRRAAAVLEGCTAIAGLVSIDLLSTRWISTPVLALIGRFTPAYSLLAGVEEGVRMTSIFANPNIFAGCMGIGVLLSLGLAASAKGKRERAGHLVCLYISALSFVLAFSLGACLAIVPGFLVMLALERTERRTGLFLLMVETFVLTLLAAFPISMTALTAWSGVQPVPMLCLAVGAAALCLLDRAGQRAAQYLNGHRKALLGLLAGVVTALAIFLTAACLLTKPVTLQTGETLRRSAYPEPGTYSVTAVTEAIDDIALMIESQNPEETMMHTSTVLYQGPLSHAAFTVPEDSLVVYFNFSAAAPVRLEEAAYAGESGSGTIPLGYRLLPSFAANRLQGLFANQNAIQRLVFFADGIKLFQQSPLIGSGMGAFENGIKSVQPFYYVTKYAHNHYIQTLVETGVAGLLLFLTLLAVSAVVVWRGRRLPLAPALGAALVFMAAHGAVEVVFSSYAYLPVAFGVFAVINLTCGDKVSARWTKKRGIRGGVLLSACGLMAAFGILLYCNMIAEDVADKAEDLTGLQKAIRLDRFEWADHMLAYVMRSVNAAPDSAERRQADLYAGQLAQLRSNSLHIHLARYYLQTGRMELGLEMAERYVTYVASDSAAWQRTFDLLMEYEADDAAYRSGIVRLAEQMDAWNEKNIGEVAVNEDAASLIARMRA